ncbi:MAG: T9SS type A sorting domain-containing protein [Ignavibacterium sp.]|nr:MAG: T9SS type A sorting domain-containing protein [Ignavibacterium sp.]
MDFWNFIGLEFYTSLTVVVPVDSVLGVDSEFTNGVSIDTSFWSPDAPAPQGNLASILVGEGNSFQIDIAYISGYDSITIIVDQYFQIHHLEFLEEVLIYFRLKDPNSITDYGNNIVDEFNLAQNYPNPFNPVTKIKFTIPPQLNPLLGGDYRGGLVTLKVYDVLGNEIATLVNEQKPAGIYEVEFDATNLTSGIYFYSLQAGGYVETKKMVLIK